MTSELIDATIAAVLPVADEELRSAVQQRLDSLTKPPGSLGRLESLLMRYALIRGKSMPALALKRLCVFCADHGVTAEGVSAFPAAVTPQMVRNFLRGGAAINVLCRRYKIETLIVDMGVNAEPEPQACNRQIARGTKNFCVEAAMSRAQAGRAILAGIALATPEVDVFGAGEMGIGNTTSASALLSIFAGLSPEETVGRGTGVDDEGIRRKIDAINRGLALHKPSPTDPIGALAAVGGFEIAGMAGLLLGAAASRRPVMLDGFISCAAALVAQALCPTASDYFLYSHRSAERAHHRMLEHLGGKALLELDMRLGEGTGAAIGIDLLESSVTLYREMATFQEAAVSES